MTRCVCALGPRVLGSAVPTRAAPRGIARNVHVTWTLRRKMSRQHSRKAKAGCRVVVEAALPDEISGLTYVSPASSRAAASQTSGNPAVSQLALGSRKAATATATSKAPHGPAAVVLTQNQLMATVGLFALGSVAACATAFMVVMAPALKAMERASVATEKASEQMEKAAVEFEKLSVQTNVDLPRTLEEMEKASEEWDALGEELREIIGNVERWGKFSGAEEALTKLTESILEEPGRAIDGARDEAESYLKRLTNDFDKAMGQLSDWERQLKGAVEGWDTQSWDEGCRAERGVHRRRGLCRHRRRDQRRTDRTAQRPAAQGARSVGRGGGGDGAGARGEPGVAERDRRWGRDEQFQGGEASGDGQAGG